MEKPIREILEDIFSCKYRKYTKINDWDGLLIANLSMPAPNCIGGTLPVVRIRLRYTDENGLKNEFCGEYDTIDSYAYYNNKFLGFYYNKKYHLSDEDNTTIDKIINELSEIKIFKCF